MSTSIAWIAAEAEPLDAAGKFFPPGEHSAEAVDQDRDIRIYRDRTVALLRRYLRYSLETGRLPSILGREIFRATVTSYSATTFEDRVLFAHDVENCLQRLDRFSQQVLARIVLQEHGHEEAARLLHCSRSTLERELLAAIDALTLIFLEVGILELSLSQTSRGRSETEEEAG